MTTSMHKYTKRTLIVIPLLLTFFTSCQRLEQLEQRVANIETTINDLVKANDRLRQELKKGKLISSYEALPEDKGWRITFSDDTSIELVNGTSAITPLLRADSDGTWSVSYDNGDTYKQLLDAAGRPVQSEAGSLRVITDSNFDYVIEVYRPSNPDQVISSYTTPMSADTSTLIRSIIQNDTEGTITITMKDNTSFIFGRRQVFPTGIVILSDKLEFSAGTTTTIEFRVNPSDAFINYDLTSADCQIELDRAGVTKAGYVTPPTNYKLTSVEQVYGEGGRLLEGQYRAYIQDTGTSTDYDEYVAIVLNLKDSDGKVYQVSSQAVRACYCHTLMTSFVFHMSSNPTARQDISTTITRNTITVTTPFISDATSLIPTFETTGGTVTVTGVTQTSDVSAQDFSNGPLEYKVSYPGDETHVYSVNIRCSELPVVYISTPGKTPVTSKEDWMDGADITIYNTDGTVDYQSTNLQIKGRGNTTWGAPKKPYALKLESKAPILGMPTHKRWVLLANYFDNTLLKNHIAFEASRMTSLPYTVRGQFVELVFNDVHVGNYYLCEQIKIDKNRVNITELKKTDIIGEAVTGGYLAEMDGYFDEVNKFRSAVRNLPYQFKEPDEEDLQPEQFAYFQNFVNEMETKMYADDWLDTGKYRDYIDLQSWADRWMVQEICGNPEDWDPRSVYVYKDRGGKLMAGPVWDYDYGSFWEVWAQAFLSKPYIYYPRLFQDNVFTSIVQTRWAIIKPLFATLPDIIRSEAERLRISCEIDNELWVRPEYIENKIPTNLPIDEAVEKLVYYVNTKLAAMDYEIQNNL